MNNNMYMGVIEDRHDPKQMGRVRVRVLGLHSPDRKNDVPIDSLPWSIVMQPTNASSCAGGISQLVEGTWVIVMYFDANLQDPIVIGSLPSSGSDVRPDFEKGFSDPFGVYPKWSNGESDTTLIGKPDQFIEHPTYTERARTHIKAIPTAIPYKVSTVLEDREPEKYDRETWSEKPLRDGFKSVYPYNSVTEYEGGIVEERDSSPSAARITNMHPSGTYDEVVVDGSKTTKIMGDGFEIVMADKNIYIKGDYNITVEGNMRQFVKGDYILEVGGDYYQTVVGDRSAKLLSNDVLEISLNRSINIQDDYNLRCGKNRTVTVGEDQIVNIGADLLETIINDHTRTVGNDASDIINNNQTIAVINDRLVITQGTHGLESTGDISFATDANLSAIVEGNLSENVLGSITTSASGAITITGSSIDLN